MVEVKAQHDSQLGAYTFRFKYGKNSWKQVEAMIILIKQIPVSDREYNPATKEWTILETSWPRVKQMFDAARFHVSTEKVVRAEDFHYEQPAAPTIVPKATLQQQLQQLLGLSASEMTDSNAVKKAYRRKALEWHPDRNNGDGTKMSELNSIWSAYNA